MQSFIAPRGRLRSSAFQRKGGKLMSQSIDKELLDLFESEVKSRLPHIDPIDGKVRNPTPMMNITDVLLECAKKEYELNIFSEDVRVFGKLESQLPSGSVKIRPALKIFEDAIKKGKLRRGQTIFEATSGNFGLALGMISRLGLNVVALVSRKLQDGVLNELKQSGIKIIDLDVDICPAPGRDDRDDTFTTQITQEYLRTELINYGFDITLFDLHRNEIERLLAKQDIINLAKLLAKIYDGFCPEQYDNELNVIAHIETTAKEIDQQLKEIGESLSDYNIICTFGTGGTSLGLSRYIASNYGKKSVHVVFPLADQDVAGIRTKSKALGLPFYRPEEYAGEHETDFEPARRLLKFFTQRGYDIGESSALALYATLQMLNYGVSRKFIVMLPDGISKYSNNLIEISEPKYEVTREDIIMNPQEYDTIIWAHTMFIPREQYLKHILSNLALQDKRILVLKSSDVRKILLTKEIPETLLRELNHGSKKSLVMCVAGSNSLSLAKLFNKKGAKANSLAGGLAGLLKYDNNLLSNVLEVSTS
ncbi:MAG: pyridoxal-phosphate dependent enzyme [Conexivisphaerales archaeon]